MKGLATLVLSLALASPVIARQAESYGRLDVTPIDAQRFEISGVPRQVPYDYWCSAGLYAQRALDLDPNARIYVVGNYQRGQRTFTFSTSPVGTAAENGPVPGFSVNVDGVSKRVGDARAECYGLQRREF